MYRLLASSDIFVYPKFYIELSSVLLLEALSLGIPSVVPEKGGLAWVTGEGAETFADGDARSLASAIERLALSHELRSKRAAATHGRAQEFEHRSLAQQLYKVLAKAQLS
jgi:glycosyltransferase involved in cell wall biosynthesis